MAILGLAQLSAASLIQGFDRRLRRRAVLADPYVNKKGLFVNNQKGIPNGMYMEVADVALTGANTATVTMKLPLTGLPVVGNTRLTGTEEAPSTKAGVLYRNNYGKTVRTEKYGVRYVDQEAYGLYKEHVNDLGDWAAQYEGLEIRMALCEVFSYNLQFGDTAATCVPSLNSNIFVAGRTIAQQAAWDPSLTTYTNAVANNMLQAGGGSMTPTNAQAASFRLFQNLAMFAQRRLMWPMDIGGKQAFCFVVSPLFAQMYADPTWQGSGGAQWIQFTQLQKEVQNWYGIHGTYHSSIGVDIHIVVDPKHPTVLPSGTAAPFSLTFGYVWPGDVDLRNLDNPNTRDVNILLGRGAVMKWDAQKLHFVQQDDDYFRIMGNGIHGVRGIQQLRFNNIAGTALEYYGSSLVLTARPTYQ